MHLFEKNDRILSGKSLKIRKRLALRCFELKAIVETQQIKKRAEEGAKGMRDRLLSILKT